MTEIITFTVTLHTPLFFLAKLLFLHLSNLKLTCNYARQAFQAAWAAACEVEGSTMVVPFGFVFLVKPISFSGPNCQPNIQFQVH